jgi:ABC-type antimicrobial peptide transport system permease subunit
MIAFDPTSTKYTLFAKLLSNSHEVDKDVIFKIYERLKDKSDVSFNLVTLYSMGVFEPREVSDLYLVRQIIECKIAAPLCFCGQFVKYETLNKYHEIISKNMDKSFQNLQKLCVFGHSNTKFEIQRYIIDKYDGSMFDGYDFHNIVMQSYYCIVGLAMKYQTDEKIITDIIVRYNNFHPTQDTLYGILKTATIDGVLWNKNFVIKQKSVILSKLCYDDQEHILINGTSHGFRVQEFYQFSIDYQHYIDILRFMWWNFPQIQEIDR